MRLFPGASCWFALVRNSTTCDGVGVGDNCGAEGAHGAAETDPCVWNDSTSLKIYNHPLMYSSEGSLASVPPASASHDCDGLTLQEEALPLAQRANEAKSSATALTTSDMPLRRRHPRRHGFAVLPTTLLQCSDSTIAQTEKFDALDCTNSTVGETRVVVCATSYELASADIFRARSCVTALLSSLGTCPLAK